MSIKITFKQVRYEYVRRKTGRLVNSKLKPLKHFANCLNILHVHKVMLHF